MSEEDEIDDDEPEDFLEDLFGFFVEDAEVISRLQSAVRELIGRSTSTPEQICHLAKLLFALRRLPLSTAGIEIDLWLGRRYENRESNGLDLSLTESAFRAGSNAYVYDPAVGGDSISETALEAEVGGFRDLAHLTAFYDWIEDFENRVSDPQQALEISNGGDESAIDWSAKADGGLWEKLDSDY